jgi:phosphoribulokinase
MTRAVILGVVGDSGAGKTTITRGLVRVLGADRVAHLSGDDYHRYDRRARVERGLTPLHPDANHLAILTQHLVHLGRGEPVFKPVYSHRDGTFLPGEYLAPAPFLVSEGLLNDHTETLRSAHDVRVFLATPEELRRRWKLERDCTRRGYTTDQVLAELDRRERDSREFIRPQAAHADIVIGFCPGADPEHLDADVALRDTLPHPDLSPLLDGDTGPTLERRDGELRLHIPGSIDPGQAAALEEAVWDRMSFASHFRARRLGEFTSGTDVRRSDSLALVQTLILYQLMVARATLESGRRPQRHERTVRSGVTAA